MITYTDYPIAGGSNQEVPLDFDAQRSLNVYSLYDKTAKKPSAITSAPGLGLPLLLASTNKVRSQLVFSGDNYVIAASKVFKIDTSFVATEILPSGAALSTTTGYVGMVHNDVEVMFVDGQGGFLINPSTNLYTKITASGFPDFPTDVAFVDTYFAVIEQDSNRWYISASGDGSKWDALASALIISDADVLVGVKTLHRLLFLFGKVSTEVWANAGARIFPFRRQNNMLLQYGCQSPATIAFGFDKLFWLSQDAYGFNSVMMTDGTRPSAVSTRAVDIAIQSYEDREDATGFVYKENGHVFYVLNFLAGNHTWVYDVTTNEWHEREMENGDRFVADNHAFFNGKHLVGSYKNGVLYEMSKNYYDYAGEAIHRQRIPRTFSLPNYQRIRIDRFQLDMNTGDVPANVKPKIYFSFSTDGGTYFKAMKPLPAGEIGQRSKRIIFRRLGTTEEFTPKIDYYDRTPFDILGAAIKYEATKS